MRPENYRQACTVLSDIHYEVQPGAPKGTHASSGILHKGRVVWIQKKPEESKAESVVSAYAEGVGIISLDPRLLVHGG